MLQRDTWLKILGRFVHLQVEEKEDWQGKKFKKETLIFPRYHQWDLVTLLVDTAAVEGPGHCYLVQHSAGSGKSNSIAWAAHQLSSLHDAVGEKVFHSVIVITDRTVLDSQLQETIYQFDVLESFLPYHKTAALADVSDPNQVHALFDKLAAAGIHQWSEVEQFAKAFFNKKKSEQALSAICKPARDRWRERHRQASKDLKQATDLLKRAKKSGDAVLIANAESEQRDAKGRKDALDMFKKDLGTFARFYEFMSQIVDFDDADLEKLNLFARHLQPFLHELMTPKGWIFHPGTIRKCAHAFTEYRNGRKWDKLFPLLRATNLVTP